MMAFFKATSDAATLLLKSIGVVLEDLDVLLGLDCSPISVVGVGSDSEYLFLQPGQLLQRRHRKSSTIFIGQILTLQTLHVGRHRDRLRPRQHLELPQAMIDQIGGGLSIYFIV